METRKLYYEDSHLSRFTSAVLSCAKAADGWEVTLAATAFYPEGVRELADAIADKCGGTAAVFSGSDGGYAYCLIARQGDLRQLGRDMTAALHGRGGGKHLCQQGRVQAAKEEIEAFFADRQ